MDLSFCKLDPVVAGAVRQVYRYSDHEGFLYRFRDIFTLRGEIPPICTITTYPPK